MNVIRISPTLLLCICLTLSTIVSAQKITGKATYKTATRLNLTMDSTMATPEMDHEAIQAQLSKAMQKEFSLSFNTYESIYKENESLEGAPKAFSGGVQVMVMGGGGSTTYRNVKNQMEMESADLFGKPFLIKDTPTKPDWKIKNEYKQIGNYECQKATYTREVKETSFKSNSEKPVNELTKNVEVVAWFTTKIPVNHGPDEYWGLPGLILEVNNGSTTIVCTKVALNPDQPEEIKEPKGGKTVSKEEFETLRDEKLTEMMNQYRGNGEGTIRIKVGG